MEIRGKTALITGGAKRVGRGITMALARAGANVAINYNSSIDEAKSALEEAISYGVNAMLVRADISDIRQVKEMTGKIINQFGAVDILINNSSIFKKTPLPTTDYSLWNEVTGVVINGSFYCANELAPKMIESGGGVIINIIDLSAWEPWPGFAAHTVGKAGLLALTRQLALDLAPKIRVNAVAPGPVLPPESYGSEKIKRTANNTLLNRWGSPDDVAQAVLYFIHADYVTGEFICVDGGQRFAHRKTEEA